MHLHLLWGCLVLLAASSRVVHVDRDVLTRSPPRRTGRLAHMLAPQAEAYPLPRPLPRLKPGIGRPARPVREADALRPDPAALPVAEGLFGKPALDRRTALTLVAATLLTDAPASIAVDGVPPSLFAQRASFEGQISSLPPLGQYSRYSDELFTPKGSTSVQLRMSFDFPAQLTQIGRALGGIQFVDGNTGLKIYVLRARLPEGTSLADTPKKWFGDSIFSPEGQIAREGVDIETYKVSKSMDAESPEGAVKARRRLQLKYTVITPANQRATDRAAFVDIYESDGFAYMLLASGGSTKWEGGEKERCEKIAESFFVGAIK